MKLKRYYILIAFNGLLFSSQGQNPIVVNILNDVELDSLTHFVRQLSGEEQVIINGVPDTIFSRHMDQPGNEIAFQYAKGKFTDYGLQIDSLQFSITGKNLFGTQVGTLFPDRKVMVGAHYDNVGFIVAPGADDNASGSAAVIEAARIFSNYSFPFTIVFALWDEEEQGLVGSMAYTSTIASSGENIIGYINMDMLGWDGNNDSIADLNVRQIANSQLLANKAIEADSIYNIELELHIVDPGSGATDHASFWMENLTAIGIGEEYDNDFNPHWHTTADSIGQFNLPYYEKCAKLVYATLADCALDSLSTLSQNEFDNPILNFGLYPNPAKDILWVDFNSCCEERVLIEICDVSGRVLESISNDTMDKVELQVSHIPTGLYTLKLSQGNKLIGVKKWLKSE